MRPGKSGSINNNLAVDRLAHNPKVGGSNPPPQPNLPAIPSSESPESLELRVEPQGLRINPRRLMPKLLDVLNVRPRINRGIAACAALTAQFQHT
jgi:hypothetical protein